MSTHGAVGIRMNGIDKVGYNHFDSYPTGLGSDILIWLSKMNLEKLKQVFNKIEFTDDWEKEAWDDKNRCLNLVFEDRHDFLGDSLFCEYAYIINLDTNMLEYYKGFNKDPKAPGRYSNFKNSESGYYGISLKKEIPLQDIFDGKYETYENDVDNFHDEGFRLKVN